MPENLNKTDESSQEFLPLDFFDDESKKRKRKGSKAHKDSTVPEFDFVTENSARLTPAEKYLSEEPKPEQSLLMQEEKLLKVQPRTEEISGSCLKTLDNDESAAVQEKTRTEKQQEEPVLCAPPENKEAKDIADITADKNEPIDEAFSDSEAKDDEVKFKPMEDKVLKEDIKAAPADLAGKAVSLSDFERNRPQKINENVNEKPGINMQQTKPVKSTGLLIGKGASIGQIFQEARTSQGLSHAEVEQKTKIKADYLKSLENDDFSKLPPMVYIIAYIKTLSNLYGIQEEDAKLLISKLKKGSEKPVAEEMIRSLENEKQVNPELKAKNKKLILIISGIAVMAVFWIAITVYFTYARKSSKKTSDSRPVASAPAKPAATAATSAIKTGSPGAVAAPVPATTTTKDSKSAKKGTAPKEAPAAATGKKDPKSSKKTDPKTSTEAKPANPKPIKEPSPVQTPETPKKSFFSFWKSSPEKPKAAALPANTPVPAKPVVVFQPAELEKFVAPQTLAINELPLSGDFPRK